ncbi:uncharacterized protein LOC119102608 isoform X2 [Pollicipes pollicipes]|uniref:uncharacterized protein LOC119102608 isoform X2 n=1 Tax=Pollicipes pollicipes TaxID=41117 RepID=UPI0018854724|nr:uncharacterized protein LOC119102608 isoform X2 [Pollicipes pollicipes]
MATETAVGPEVPVTRELMEEVWRYQTARTVLEWPVVTNATNSVLDAYATIKKDGDVARVVLGACEDLTGVYCRLVALPIARTALVRTPLGLADRVGSTAVHLVEKAMPQLKNREDPVQLNRDLLLSVLLLPLTISLVLAHQTLEGIASVLVTTFPSLQVAAEGFEQRCLAGQWFTLLLMTTLFLPLQLLSHPVQTVISWVRETVALLISTASDWVSWLQSTVSDWASWLAATASEWVGRVAAKVYEWVGGVAATARHYVIRALALVAALVETMYYAVFEATGLMKVLQQAWEWVRQFLQQRRDGAQQLLHSAADTAPVKGLVRRMRTSSPTLSSRWFGTCASSGAAPSSPRAPPASRGGAGPAAGATWLRGLLRPAPRAAAAPREVDPWTPTRIVSALLLTLLPVALAVILLSLK